MVSGMAGFTRQSGDLHEDKGGNALSKLMIVPSLCYFVVPNLAVGGDFSLNRTTQGDNNLTSLALGPKIVYFMGEEDQKILPYLGAGVNYLRIKAEDTDEEVSATGYMFKLGGGIISLISSHLGLVFEVGYLQQSLEPEDNGESESGNMLVFGAGLVGFWF